MNMKTKTSLLLLPLFTYLTGCASAPYSISHEDNLEYQDEQEIRDSFWRNAPVVSATEPQEQSPLAIVEEETDLYSFVANDLPLAEASKLFGEMHDLNIVVEPGVEGKVNVGLKDLPFSEVMESLLGAQGYYWERRGNIVYIKSWETRTFTIDYIRLVRSGSGVSEASVNSSTGESAEGEAAGSMRIQNEDNIDFWSELEDQLLELISNEGRIVINRVAGTVQVSDRHPRVEEVASFIEHINEAVHRQVDIEVKIVEVTLNEDNALGVDWTRLVADGDGEFIQGSISNIISTPAGGISALPSTIDLSFSDIDDGFNDITTVIQALSEQGDVRIVSQPHIRTLNNQSALIKVGTDRTFFRREQSTDTTSAGFVTTFTDVPQVVTEGIVLSITPQISAGGWITMDVSPVVTRVSSISEAFDEDGNVTSTAPNLDISQASSLVRARGGETVVLGGLIQNQQIETVRRVPGLGHLPVLGRLFSANYQNDVKKELIMLMTPRLVN